MQPCHQSSLPKNQTLPRPSLAAACLQLCLLIYTPFSRYTLRHSPIRPWFAFSLPTCNGLVERGWVVVGGSAHRPCAPKANHFHLPASSSVNYVICLPSRRSSNLKEVAEKTIHCKLESNVQALFLAPCLCGSFHIQFSFEVLLGHWGPCDIHLLHLCTQHSALHGACP